MCGIKTPQQDFALKMQGGLMREGGGGGGGWGGVVFAEHYGTHSSIALKFYNLPLLYMYY